MILKVKEVLQNNCGLLYDPMGKQDTVQMSQEVPVVHPIIKMSEDHFTENTAFTDGRYRVLEEERKAYKDAEKVQFDDVVGLVVCSKNFLLFLKYLFITAIFTRFITEELVRKVLLIIYFNKTFYESLL